ncbi:MAG: oxidoreductase [Gammaproteobacteria bacterium]|nr:oxidoreductase [Gammaproteobacteria bacterium]
MIKVGIIGYGNSAQTFHLPFITSNESLELVAISSSQTEAIKERYPTISIFDSADDLILNSGIELVIITAPNHVHYSLAKQALEQGLHVIVEKPMVTKSSEAEELIQLAKTRSLVLSVFQNRRWDGDFLTIKKLLKQKALGEIRFFESHFDRFRPLVRQRWREQPGPGAGFLFDLGPHLIDQALCLFGSPDSITSRCLALRNNSEITDYFHILLHYEALEVALHASTFSAGPNRRFRLEGTKGSYDKYGLDPQEAQLHKGLSPSDILFGAEQINQFGTLYLENSKYQIDTETGCYQQFYLKMVDAINNGGSSPVDCEEIVSVIKIIELAEISSQQGRTVSMAESITQN